MFSGKENGMILSKPNQPIPYANMEVHKLSKMQCCEYCGTIFDPKQGSCPICGSTRFHAVDSDTGDAASQKDVSADDFLTEPGITPTPEETATTETPRVSVSADKAELDCLDELLDDGDVSAQSPGTPHPETPATRNPASGAQPARDREVSRQTPRPDNSANAPRRTRDDVRTGTHSASGREVPREPGADKKPPRKKGTITTRDKVICLVLATLVCIVGLFILYRFIRPHTNGRQTEPSQTQTQPESTADLRCRSVVVVKTLTLKEIGQTMVLDVTLEPADTTDALVFSSDTPEVVTVTGEGVLTAVSSGTANITVTCGNVMAICTVTCDIQEETKPTETTVATEETVPTESTITGPDSLELNREDVSFETKGETVRLTTGDYDDIVTWSSSDTSVVTVENGLVTAVGGGTAYVYAKYGDIEAQCIFRCRFEAGNDPDEDEDVTISHTDVSIDVDESFTLRLKDADGNTLEVNWVADDASICSVTGNKVTGLAKGRTTVRCTYNNVEYECIVRVR